MKSILPQPGAAGLPLPPGGNASAAWAHDWAATPLGPPEDWPQSLKTAASIVLGSNVPMFLAWGPELSVLHNDSYGEVLGDRRPALGKPLPEIWSDIWDQLDPLRAKVLSGETVFVEAAPRPRRRGGVAETIWVTSCYTPVRGEGGGIEGIFGVVAGISDESGEQRIRESEERFRLIADSAPVPMWVTRLDRKRSFVNRAYVDFLAISYEEAVDYDWRHIIHPEDGPRILAESLAGEASLETFMLEGRFRRGDGEWRWLRSISQPRWGPGGEHIGFIGVAHDITEWKLAEEAMLGANRTLQRSVTERTADLGAALAQLRAEQTERERAEEALRQAQKMEAVGRLTGGIAHDFNNLLTPVIGGLEMIVGRLDDPRLKRIAEAALESGRRGAKLTTQLLAFSRIQRLSMAPVAVNQVIGNLRQILAHTIGPDIDVRTVLDRVAGHALCDENQLENAILNLAINARDAMPDGGVLTISTAAVDEPGDAELAAGTYVRVSVADTGHGMTAEVAARATEPFFSTKPFGKGTGLGLAQVHGIAHQSGGTLRIDSRETAGTTVQILLPRVEPEGVTATPPGPRETRSDDGPVADILVVDDDADVRAFIAAALGDLGHRGAVAPSGQAALAALDEAVPDLMLVDFAMPDMNGAELAMAVRARHPDLPILFITGYAESGQIEQALGRSVMVLRKPFGIDELAQIIRAALPARIRR
ncbi:response regulator [Sphingosinicella sp. LHD-64]|uniref:hybrid sensor histidine kinase/response regulator n=1 Tax=Sphingosinicella sp. LHD-64 TaxID=3072139 RepID=UPI00280F57FE|nr:response regulator [Sphingosinicella sp. LHD-64]MDQ8755895.1 response regulator [Sphingosinicella sp. LHD-64]